MKSKTKVFRSYQQQLDLLRQRGLIIPDDDFALKVLREKNYYRLSAYSLTLRSFNPCLGEDHFHTNASFDDIVELYQFDEAFRAAILAASFQVETNLKAYVAYYHAPTMGQQAIFKTKILRFPGTTPNCWPPFPNLFTYEKTSLLCFIITMT